MTKDWTGNAKSLFTTNGDSSHSSRERETSDYYATDPKAVEQLLELESFSNAIWEPACGEGHISKVLKEHGHYVRSTDLVDRGFGEGGIDFLMQWERWRGDIITNPPYKLAQEFVEKAIQLIDHRAKVAMFLKLTFLEGQARYKLFKNTPPRRVWVAVHRLECPMNGVFSNGKGSAVCYAWFVWEKGFTGKPEIGWFN